jgi:hypothetical protein
VKSHPLVLVLLLALAAPCAWAADAGIFSIVEGSAHLLRDTTWYKLVPGAHLGEGDIVVATGTGQVQVELVTGGTFNLGSPGTFFAAAAPVVADKITGPVELWLPEGWLKLAANAPGTGFRVLLVSNIVNAAEAVIVMHAKSDAMELFMESGTAKLADAGTDKARPTVATDLKAGDYVTQSPDRPLRYESRAPAAFVATVPRHMIDALPTFAAKFKTAKVQLVPEREVSFAEAEPWLMGPYRKTFLKRFEPRLKDREFRAAVEAQIARYPEWDRILHPEKYRRKVPIEAK